MEKRPRNTGNRMRERRIYAEAKFSDGSSGALKFRQPQF